MITVSYPPVAVCIDVPMVRVGRGITDISAHPPSPTAICIDVRTVRVGRNITDVLAHHP
jgi:hypothetical protein